MKRLVRCSVMVLAIGCGDDGGGTTKQQDAAILGPDACVTGTAQTVFLNKAAGMYTMGPDNASTNVSSALDMARTLDAWPHDVTNWAAIKTCVETALAPFNITVTDVDPATAVHHEVVFTTQYWAGGSGTVGSLGPIACMATKPTTTISFVFSAGHPASTPVTACEAAVAQLAAAAAGLDHSRDCKDALGIYSTPCGAKTFLDQEVACGETDDRNCQCTMMPTQSSYRTMLQIFGPSCS